MSGKPGRRSGPSYGDLVEVTRLLEQVARQLLFIGVVAFCALGVSVVAVLT